MHTVVLVDDQAAILKRLSELVNDTGVARVVGVETNSEKALTTILRLRPDVVLVDVSMPKLSGVELTKALISQWPQARILAVSAHADGVYLRNMMAAGASGYVLKDNASSEIGNAIEALLNGGQWIGEGVSETA